MHVLVVGGAGYIGSHTCLELAAQGHVPLVYDNLSTGFRELTNSFELIEADLFDNQQLAGALKRVEAVIHFAASAYVGESVEQPRKYFRNNVEGSLALLDAVLDSRVRTFIFSSTCATYGEPTVGIIDEKLPQNPVNPYGASKLFVEHALRAYRRSAKLRAVCLRYFNAAGADAHCRAGELHEPETHLIPLALQAASGLRPQLTIFGNDFPTPDGTCVRDYIHVDDLATAHIAAIDYLNRGGEEFAMNLGTGSGNSVLDVVNCISRVTGHQVPFRIGARREGDPAKLVANPALANRELGWKAQYDLDQIVSTAWAWMRRPIAKLSFR
jgi:UDP-arabinose 4-epimerase